MNTKKIFFLVCIVLIWIQAQSQINSYKISLNISITEDVKSSFNPEGRLFLIFDKNPEREPREFSVYHKGVYAFAKNISQWNKDKNLTIRNSDGWISWQSQWSRVKHDSIVGSYLIPEWSFENIPQGTYIFQCLWDQDTIQSSINAPGNLFSKETQINVYQNLNIDISISEKINPIKYQAHELVKEIRFLSDTLSKWWGKPMYLNASVLLPSKYYKNPDSAYPIRYYIGRFGETHTRVYELVNDRDEVFIDWWMSDDAPQIITVFLNGEGPYGDCYQMDSENNGPFGYSLIYELIPYIESEYRGTDSPKTRFVDGCSTGGWVSLALQLFYSDQFNGCFSYSPDPVSFNRFLVMDIYNEKNAFINLFGYLRPFCRHWYFGPLISMKDYTQYENVLGPSNTYVDSKEQFGVFIAVYSPKDQNGLPSPLFDPINGIINSEVAQAWKKYDLTLFIQENWKELQSKIQDKIFIHVGEKDMFYLNNAVREFDEITRTKLNPPLIAEIVYSPLQGHCHQYSHREVLEKIAIRLKNMDND